MKNAQLIYALRYYFEFTKAMFERIEVVTVRPKASNPCDVALNGRIDASNSSLSCIYVRRSDTFQVHLHAVLNDQVVAGVLVLS